MPEPAAAAHVTAAAPEEVGRGPRLALVLAAAAVVVVVLLPCIVTFTTQLYFDVDPRMQPAGVPDIRVGPAGYAWLAAAELAVGAGAIAASGWAGGRPRWGSAALAGLGMAGAGWQMTTAAANRPLVGAWIAAAAVGLGAAHLGRHALGRRVLIAGLVAALIPMTLDAAWSVGVEQPEASAAMRQRIDHFAAAHGWTRGSPQYKLYARRVTSPGAVGTFGLANILGSVAAALTALAGGLAVGMAITRQGAARYRALLPAALAGAGMVTVGLTHSKGAALALPIAAGVFALTVWTRRRRGAGAEKVKTDGKEKRALPPAAPAAGFPKRWWVGGIGVVVLIAVVGGVLARGAWGPPGTPGGERSLLYRYQYWQAAGRIVEAQPISHWLTGVGPRGFQRGYLWAKDPTQPEEVKSAHNVFVDYGVMLGLGGAAWGALLLMWLWGGGCATGAGGGRASPGGLAAEPVEPGLERRMLVLAAGIAVVVFGARWWVEIRHLDLDPAVVWLAGAVGYVFAAGALAGRAWDARPLAGAAVFAAATAVLAHNQISMAFYQPASAALGWCVVGLAGAGRGGQPRAAPARGRDAAGPGRARRWPAMALAGALAGAGAAMGAGYAWPTTIHESHLTRAAAALRDHQRGEALAELRAADAVLPGRWEVLRWRVRLGMERAGEWAAGPNRQRAEAAMGEVVKRIDAYAQRWGESARTHRLRANVYARWGRWLHRPEKTEACASELEAALRLAPYSMEDARRLWRLSWELGQTDRAEAMARRMLELDVDNRLDPVKRLTPKERKAVRDYLKHPDRPPPGLPPAPGGEGSGR